jgi:hypothetical protein
VENFDLAIGAIFSLSFLPNQTSCPSATLALALKFSENDDRCCGESMADTLIRLHAPDCLGTKAIPIATDIARETPHWFDERCWFGVYRGRF